MKVYRNRNRSKDKENIKKLIKTKAQLMQLVMELEQEVNEISFAMIVDDFLEVVESSHFDN